MASLGGGNTSDVMKRRPKKVGSKIEKALRVWYRLRAQPAVSGANILQVRKDIQQINITSTHLRNLLLDLPPDPHSAGLKKLVRRNLAEMTKFAGNQHDLLRSLQLATTAGSAADSTQPLAIAMHPQQMAMQNVSHSLVLRQAKNRQPVLSNSKSAFSSLPAAQHLCTQTSGPKTRTDPIVSEPAAQNLNTTQQKLLTPIQSWIRDNATPILRKTSNAYSKVKTESCEAMDMEVSDAANLGKASSNIESIQKAAAWEAVNKDVPDASDLEKALGNIDSIR